MKRLLIAYLLIFLSVVSVNGQENGTSINADNISDLHQVALLGRSSSFADVDWSPDGALIAVATDAGVMLYDTQALRVTPRLLPTEEGSARSVAFSPDGRLIASGIYRDDRSYLVQIWDAQSGEPVAQLIGNAPEIIFSPDSRWLLGFDTLWSLETFQEYAHLDNSQGTGTFSPDSSTVVFEIYNAIKTFDIATQQFSELLPITVDWEIKHFQYTPDNTLLAFVEYGISMVERSFIWDVTHNLAWKVIPQGIFTLDVDINENGIIAAGAFNQIHLWNLQTGELEASFPVSPADGSLRNRVIKGINFDPSGERIAAIWTGMNDTGYLFGGTLGVWDVEAIQNGETEPTVILNSSVNICIRANCPPSCSPYSYWDVQSLTEIILPPCPRTVAAETPPQFESIPSVRHYSYSSDMKYLAAAQTTENNTANIFFWNLETGSQTVLAENTPYATLQDAAGIRFTPDNQLLSWVEQNTVMIWDVQTLAKIAEINFPDDDEWISTYSISPNNAYLMIGEVVESGSRIVFYDIRAGEWVAQANFRGNAGNFQYNRDGSLLAIMNYGGDVLLWDMNTMREVARIDNGLYFGNQINFSPDNTLMAVSANPYYQPELDHTSLWEIATMTPAAVLEGKFFQANEDWSLLATTDLNGITRLWAVNQDNINP